MKCAVTLCREHEVNGNILLRAQNGGNLYYVGSTSWAVLKFMWKNSVPAVSILFRIQAGGATAIVSSHLHCLDFARCEGKHYGRIMLQSTQGNRKTIAS
jgi:hypothetical protein